MRNWKIFQRSSRHNKEDITCGSDESILTKMYIGKSKKNNIEVLSTKISVLGDDKFQVMIRFRGNVISDKIVSFIKD